MPAPRLNFPNSRAIASVQQLPVILMTGQVKTENVIAAKKAGVSNYIVKPFSAITLKEKIETALAV
jgi:two-component system chemotaxis response regulator CheY